MGEACCLFLVVPCYNEEEVLADSMGKLKDKLERMMAKGLVSKSSRVVFVDDGSKDRTWEMIEQGHLQSPMVDGIKLAKNSGHQNAVLAGMMSVMDDCDAVITLDADLQDDIEVLDRFVEEFQKGSQIVYGVRSCRDKDTFFKRASAQSFYKVLSKMGIEIVYNHADYRLMSRRALHELAGYKEVNLFLRGIVPLLGFSTSQVTYERKERMAGESKYPLKKMLALAMDGITSFSIKPIRFISTMGVLLFLTSLIMLIVFLVKDFMGVTVAGWSTIVISIWGIGGLQLLAIGIIGEYIGKIYMEAKGRPRYIVEKFLGSEGAVRL